MFFLVLRDEPANRTLKIIDVKPQASPQKTKELALLAHQKFYASTRRDPRYLLQLHEAQDHEELFHRYPQYADARN